MVLDHTNKYIKLRGISVKFAWFQHPFPPDFRGVTWNIIEYWILGEGLQFSSAYILYLHVTLISLWQAAH